MKEITLTCPECFKDYKTKKEKQVYCDISCKKRFAERIRIKKEMEHKKERNINPPKWVIMRLSE